MPCDKNKPIFPVTIWWLLGASVLEWLIKSMCPTTADSSHSVAIAVKFKSKEEILWSETVSYKGGGGGREWGWGKELL